MLISKNARQAWVWLINYFPVKTNICGFRSALILVPFLTFLVIEAKAAQVVDIAPSPMDGVNIEAVETYPSFREHGLGLGLGIYPFNPYYMGLLVNGSYLYNFSSAAAWEIVNVNYAYSIQNDLTTELADRYSVNPRRITRLNFLVSTTGHFTILNGKFVLLKEHIRYFRTAAIAGLGMAMTNEVSSIAPQIGLRFEVRTGEGFSWALDVRDTIAISTTTNYLTFTSGINIGL